MVVVHACIVHCLLKEEHLVVLSLRRHAVLLQAKGAKRSKKVSKFFM